MAIVSTMKVPEKVGVFPMSKTYLVVYKNKADGKNRRGKIHNKEIIPTEFEKWEFWLFSMTYINRQIWQNNRIHKQMNILKILLKGEGEIQH